MYFTTWSVAIPDKPTVTLTQENGKWLTVDVPSDALSVSLNVMVSYDPGQLAEEPTNRDPKPSEPDQQPPRILSLGASNFYSGSGAITLGTPTDPEYSTLAANAGAGFSSGVTSTDPRMIFECLCGRQICATLDRTALNQCGIDSIVAPSLQDGDNVIIQCPGAGNYCLSEVRQGYGQYVELNYPLFEPRARFRVRILGASGYGQVFSYAEWMVRFPVGAQERYY